MALSSRSLFIVAIVFGLAAIAVWAVFLRPLPVRTAVGTIAHKTFKPAGTYWQYPVGLNRSFLTATPIPVTEAYVFEVRIDGLDGPVFYSLNTTASRAFDIGQSVQLSYRERVIPFASKRLYVLDMISKDNQ